jgi:hypothetical protein
MFQNQKPHKYYKKPLLISEQSSKITVGIDIKQWF